MAAVQNPHLSFGLLDEIFLFPTLEEMNEQATGGWSPSSPYEKLSPRSDDVANLPGKASQSLSSGGSAASLSPSGASRILTPASTSLLDLSDSAGFEDHASDVMSRSPGSNVSPVDGFVHVSRDAALEARPQRSPAMASSTQPPPGRSGGSSSTHASHTSRESSVSHPTHGSGAHWQSFAPSSNLLMGDQHAPRQESYPLSNDMILNASDYRSTGPDDLLSNVGEFAHPGYPYPTSDGLPFRTLPDGSVQRTAYHASAMPPRSSAAYSQHAVADSTGYDQSVQYQHLFAGAQFGPAIAHSSQLGLYHPPDLSYSAHAQAAPPAARHSHPPFVYGHSATGIETPNIVVPSNATVIGTPMIHHHHPYAHTPSTGATSQSDAESTPAPSQSRRNTAGNASAKPQALVPPATSSTAPGVQRLSPGITKNTRRGGRPKHSHLPDDARARSSEMRKLGACWRCVMQRDPCDQGDTCNRCSMRSQKGQLYFFDCDRSKLPDFVYDFLPPSMTVMHQKQSIEDTVNRQVLEWDTASGHDIYLSSGYGPPLRWKVYEFKPRTQELLWQLQYFQDPLTGQSTRHQKYSPPFGLMKLDTSDTDFFEAYLNDLLNPEHLWEFGWSCYGEENQVDEGCFQATLLDLMCQLYQKTSDNELKQILRDILRMLIITYIMGHTLTIAHETLYTVISNVQHSNRPPRLQPFTSPRLANQQLKFFFAIERERIYKNVLRWQQATLHQAGKKESTWLSAFCVMLGLAMVLEEVQRLLQVQADAKADKGDMTLAAATTEAYNACERIDQRFRLLVGLFQCKYRDKKWNENGSFGPGTPELRDPEAQEFLRSLRALLQSRHDHLRSRESVTFALENQCLYTTRLTARFLLPFLSLPRT